MATVCGSRRWDSVCRRHREDQRFKGTSLETLRNMVAAGSGMTLVPRLAVPANPEEGASAIVR